MAKQNFYSELNLRKTNINLGKLQLSAVDDANDSFEKIYQVIQEYRNETKDLEINLKNYKTILEELKDTEFMVDEGINELDEVRKVAEDNLKELEDGASELGLAVNDIPVYMELMKGIDDLEEFYDELTKYYQDITDITG